MEILELEDDILLKDLEDDNVNINELDELRKGQFHQVRMSEIGQKKSIQKDLRLVERHSSFNSNQ